MKYIYLLSFTIILVSSCTSYKKLTYLQDVEPAGDSIFYNKQQPEYKIQNQDILYIKVISIDQEVNEAFSVTPEQTTQQFQNETSLFINGFVVNDSGNVELPVAGEVPVAGKTLEEAKLAIEEAAARYVKDATIIVKLISFKFTVMGEVNRPGIYRNYNNQLTVMEALGMAGDLSDYANRSEVLVLRPSREGTYTYKLDLTNDQILTSDGYFLLPNDVVYVKPIKQKIFQLNLPSISFALSSVSTLILILNYIRLNT